MSNITDQERLVVMKLADVWDEFLALPVEHQDDINEFRTAIHAAQKTVLARSGRRELNSK